MGDSLDDFTRLMFMAQRHDSFERKIDPRQNLSDKYHPPPEIFSDSMSLARLASLKSQQSDPNAKFSHQRIRISTIPNDGLITIETNFGFAVFVNKCIAIAIFHGMKHTIELTPEHIMRYMGFTETKDMFDSNKAEHRVMMANFLAVFPGLKIELYIGQQDKDEWFTSQLPAITFGIGKHIIRILNKTNSHFECICNQEMPPIPDLSNSVCAAALLRQEQLERAAMKPYPPVPELMQAVRPQLQAAAPLNLSGDLKQLPPIIEDTRADSKPLTADPNKINLVASYMSPLSSSADKIKEEKPKPEEPKLEKPKIELPKPEEPKLEVPKLTDEEYAKQLQVELDQIYADEQLAAKMQREERGRGY